MAKYNKFRNFIYANQNNPYDEPLLLRRWHVLSALYELSKDQLDLTLVDISDHMVETFDYSPPIKGLAFLINGYERFGVVTKEVTHRTTYYRINRGQLKAVFSYILNDIDFMVTHLEDIDDA